MNTEIRPARTEDQAAVIRLIDSIYREYGDRVCLEDADSDLLDLHQSYATKDGEFIVLTDQDQVIGTHALLPLFEPNHWCTFRRLYLHPDHRGSGWGERLMKWAIERASERGFHGVEFWSDTRFKRAHRFFQRSGFQTNHETRDLADAFEPYQEYRFWMELDSSASDKQT